MEAESLTPPLVCLWLFRLTLSSVEALRGTLNVERAPDIQLSGALVILILEQALPVFWFLVYTESGTMAASLTYSSRAVRVHSQGFKSAV